MRMCSVDELPIDRFFISDFRMRLYSGNIHFLLMSAPTAMC